MLTKVRNQLSQQYTRKDIARLAKISVDTVKRDVKKGKLREIPNGSRRRRYWEEDVVAYLDGRYPRSVFYHKPLTLSRNDDQHSEQ